MRKEHVPVKMQTIAVKTRDAHLGFPAIVYLVVVSTPQKKSAIKTNFVKVSSIIDAIVPNVSRISLKVNA